MFKQFAVTIVIAVVLSGIVALTLTPALCALLLRESNDDAYHRLLRRVQPRGSPGVTDRYASGVGRVLGRPAGVARGVRGAGGAGRRALERVPTGVHSHRGQGLLRDRDAAARRRVAQRTKAVIQRSRASCARSRRCVNVVAFAGLDVLTRTNQTNSATIFILLKPWDERGKDESHRRDHQAHQRQAVRDEGRGGLRLQPSRDSRASAPPSGVEVNLQNRSGPGRARLRAAGAGVPRGGQPAARGAGDDRPTSAPTCRRSTWTWTARRPRRAA